MNKSIAALIAITLSSTASASLISKESVEISTKVEVIRLAVKAKCKAPAGSDDTYKVVYSKESAAEINQYRGYSSSLSSHTCGVGGNQELSSSRLESAEVVLFNYGAAKTSFENQILDVVEKM
jgi:hypothetical protein